MLIRMVSAGESTGKIDTMLEKMADFWDEEIEAILDALTSLIEPLLICVLGVIVGGIVIAMFLPIFKLNDVVYVKVTEAVKKTAARAELRVRPVVQGAVDQVLGRMTLHDLLRSEQEMADFRTPNALSLPVITICAMRSPSFTR